MHPDTTFTPWLEWLDSQQQMLDSTIELSRINSGTFNTEGVNAVAETVNRISNMLGGEREFIEVAPYLSVDHNAETVAQPLGRALRITIRLVRGPKTLPRTTDESL